jgi:hypothetical protein
MTTRLRLLLFSAPVAVLSVMMIAKSISVVIAGHSASSAFAERDTDSLRAAVDTLNVVNIAEPAKAHFAAGGLAVLENRLEDADREFAASLSQTALADSCPARVNLELVRETLGDRAGAVPDGKAAGDRYRSAQTVVQEAPGGCFAGNTDPDAARRQLRADAAARLEFKLAAIQVAPPPAAPVAPAVAPPPPESVGVVPPAADDELRLDPGVGDPLDRLRQILQDAAQR